jgi:uncharacterized protein
MPEEAVGKTGVPSESRNKPTRPRDLLGRPQPWGAENQLDMPDFDRLSVEENHELARTYAAQARWFPAHEAWETAWKRSRGTGDEELFKGLSQMGAGYVHLLRGNVHGARTLLARAERRVKAYPPGSRGVDTAGLAARLVEDIARIERGDLVPGPDASVQPLTV